jgi:hypothetical protein
MEITFSEGDLIEPSGARHKHLLLNLSETARLTDFVVTMKEKVLDNIFRGGFSFPEAFHSLRCPLL